MLCGSSHSAMHRSENTFLFSLLCAVCFAVLDNEMSSSKGVYTGPTVDRLRHGIHITPALPHSTLLGIDGVQHAGKGTYEFANKFFKYEGEYERGLRHGHGCLRMADGSYYQGAFYRGQVRATGAVLAH